MDKKEIAQFFEYLGEIRRDITASEFLMRCIIAHKDGDIEDFPKAPYKKNRTYKKYPKSFGNFSFKMILSKFIKHFPNVKIPNDIVNFRNAMAHGIIAGINQGEVNELIKFREEKTLLKIEFSIELKLETLKKINTQLKKFRQNLSQIVNSFHANTK